MQLIKDNIVDIRIIGVIDCVLISSSSKKLDPTRKKNMFSLYRSLRFLK